MIFLMIILIMLLIMLLLWLTGFLLATDFSVPLKDARRFKNILVIFPHADDETITCGGSLHRFSAKDCSVTLAILTKGEKGPKHYMTETSQIFERKKPEQWQRISASPGLFRKTLATAN